MPSLYSNPYSFLLYSLAFIAMNFLEAGLIIRDLFYWKNGHLDHVKTYRDDWISIIMLTAIVWTSLNLGFYASIHLRYAQMQANIWMPICIGFLLIVVGLVLRVTSVRTLGNFFRLLVLVQKNQHIITSGPYRYVRHPSYTAAIIMLIGVGFFLTNWISVLVLFMLPLIAYVIRISIEEHVMIRHFPKEYEEYRKKTPYRLVPFFI